MKKFLAGLLTALFVIVLAKSGNGQQPDMTIDAATKTQVIDSLLKEVNDRYVFPEVAKQMKPTFADACPTKNTIQLPARQNLPKN